jgi:formate transporter
MAKRAEYIGLRKAETTAMTLLSLDLLAGAFIVLGAIFSTTIATCSISIKEASGETAFVADFPYGLNRLLTGLVFYLGVIIVVVGGAELFTGDNLIVKTWARGKVTTLALLHNWVIVYMGNFVGSIGTAVIVFISKQYLSGSGAVDLAALNTARVKVEFGFWQAIALGVLGKSLV